MVDIFTKELADCYDERNQKLSPINDCLHFLMSLVLEKMPAQSKVLCVGAGTGAEIISMARVFPDWCFVAVEPSLSMLTVGMERLKQANLSDRCEFIHGYIQDLPEKYIDFDVALSIFVGHFIKREDRLAFFKGMIDRLRNGGYFVNAEISYDLYSKQYPHMLDNWKIIQRLMGGTAESLDKLPKTLKEVLSVLPEVEVEELIRKAGINLPIKFYQAFMISAWYGVK